MYYDLSHDLDNYLDTVLGVAKRQDDRVVAELARAELPHLTQAIRALLDQHRPDSRRRCPTCHARRWLFWRRPNMPCRAYLAAHRRLVVLAERETEHAFAGLDPSEAPTVPQQAIAGTERHGLIPTQSPVNLQVTPSFRPTPYQRPTPYPRAAHADRAATDLGARSGADCTVRRNTVGQIGAPL